jgi:hypothetical protein
MSDEAEPIEALPRPMRRASDDLGSVGVALFEIPSTELASFTLHLTQLANDSWQFAWLPISEEKEGNVLVRVEKPPRILIERAADEGIVYREQKPGVWIQLGAVAVDHAEASTGKTLLLAKKDGEVREFDPVPFETKPSLWIAGQTISKLVSRPAKHPVPLKLVASRGDEVPTLWVLRDDALRHLSDYCRTANENLLNRFTVAVAAPEGVPFVVLRTVATMRGHSPLFMGEATSFRTYQNLPNLYLPQGMRLTPHLRRDALRESLGVESGRFVWLLPLEGGAFQIESLPESAFRPLTEWIEYRVPEARFWEPWLQSPRWEFAPFMERTEEKASAKTVLSNATKLQKKPGRFWSWIRSSWKREEKPLPSPVVPPLQTLENLDPFVDTETALRNSLKQGERLHHARPETSNSALERCQRLELRFLSSLNTMTSEEQRLLWLDLAATYDSIGNHADAALCWLNALWNDENPALAWAWLRAEGRAARAEVKILDPVPWLAMPAGPGTTRAMAAWVVWAANQSPPHPVLVTRTSEIQARLEAHEQWLPARAVWLARTALAKIGQADVLGLARTRDRLSERLLTGGPSLELDTPSFLRFAGDGVRGRFHEARRWLIDKRELIQQWITHLPEEGRLKPVEGQPRLQSYGLEPEISATRAYADLMIAWGLARFGEASPAANIQRQAMEALPADSPVHELLREAFTIRIAQIREGKSPVGPLPKSWQSRYELLGYEHRYPIDKLRQHSRILEPTEQIDPYQTVFRLSSRAKEPRADSLTTPESLNRALLRLKGAIAPTSSLILQGLTRSSELTVEAIDILFAHLGTIYSDTPKAIDRTRLIEQGLAAAANWERPDVALELVDHLSRMTQHAEGWQFTDGFTSGAFRSLRRLGMREQIDFVLQQVVDGVLEGETRQRFRELRPGSWPAALRILLQATVGWYYVGRDEEAHQLLDEARRDLFATEGSRANRLPLAIAYAGALGQAPVRVALGRLEELFQRLTDFDIRGNSYYTLPALDLIETAVRTVVADDFTLGPPVRAWLDADEFAIRRRLRDDLKHYMTQQGLG